MASVPAVLTAIREGIPTAILNPDALPGRANRYLAPRVDAVFAQWDLTKSRLSRANVVVTGCPVRSAFLAADRTAGIARFGLDSARRTLLVTGASQGARTINDAILANSDFLSRIDGWQILHLTGESDYQRVQSGYCERKVQAAVISYTDHMAEALAAADVVVSRAGASTLAELTALGRASILMPYPYHRDQHQMANARCLEEHGAAMVVKDTTNVTTNAPALATALNAVLTDRAARETMAQAAAGLGRPNAADSIAGFALQGSRNGMSVAGVQR
jgi:UDP-N-acetylglucosamine--N-acetylmuramyl-(pentapeptide) pyrophosphoryl-undecaprenol N-acetylglucosamine transferase